MEGINVLLTIYTPTYNRAELLPRLYNSLCRQTCKEFEWMIIDDGSTDNTQSLIEQWKKENFLRISYFYKENGGVHTAREFAYESIKSELIWGVDSDDWVVDDAVEKILAIWNSKKDDNLCGIFAPVKDYSGSVPSIKYPDVESVSFQDLFYKFKSHGDQTIIIRSNVIKKLRKFPVFENEKLVSESYKWIQIPNNMRFLILRDFTTYIEYQPNGYTHNVRTGFFKNLQGYHELYRIHIQYCVYLSQKIEYCVKYIISSFFLKQKKIVRNSPNVFLTILLYPIGFFLYLIFSLKWAKYRNL